MNPSQTPKSSAPSSASAGSAPAAAAPSMPVQSGGDFAKNFASVHLPGFESRNPNLPTIKFIASLVKGALMALSLGMGPGQMLLMGIATGTAGAGKSIGPLAQSKPASPLVSGGGAGLATSRGGISSPGSSETSSSSRFPI